MIFTSFFSCDFANSHKVYSKPEKVVHDSAGEAWSHLSDRDCLPKTGKHIIGKQEEFKKVDDYNWVFYHFDPLGRALRPRQPFSTMLLVTAAALMSWGDDMTPTWRKRLPAAMMRLQR